MDAFVHFDRAIVGSASESTITVRSALVSLKA